ncbi:chaperone protein DnaJ [Acidimicrobium ferrooxidans DSM 10331]|uniref:Chaperone protein DnaJ n=1 Tax=Acidimicrobium ferrooxidans (strain DSM 10331 / JCM 15462 / NBRC 103882 / ICP) TaxID=525909 RepID=C7M1W9_ACIFD|nr:molecular chaperone DnaJ [Acidimicrobium ferrooxidans]ACU54866.1 chaperone protein DnaJ [Acidimicrobium ferrooxidans DSM 10331]
MAPAREWFEKDYYKILGVPETASEKDIQRAYRKLARQYHPDANPGHEERFKEVSAAYDVLGDPAKRKEYDEVRRLGPLGSMGAPTGNGTRGAGTFHAEDLGDLIGSLFNRGRREASGPRRGADQEAEVTISFEDAARGAEVQIPVTGEAACSVCKGTGAAPGTVPKTCARCNGTGTVSDNQGFFSFSQPCPACHGRGLIIEQPCPSCHGTGTEHRTRIVKARIPAGVEPDSTIRLRGRGAPGRNGAPAGDLFVRVHVLPHPMFGRRGADLTLRRTISFADAALGTVLTVPTLDGTVSVKVPPGTSAGTVLRVRGKGLPNPKRKGARGDLLVTIDIDVPDKLDAKQRRYLEDFARVFPHDAA